MSDSIINTTLVQVEKLQEQNMELQMTIDQLQQKQGQAQNTKKFQDEIKDANSAFIKLSDLMIQKKVPINNQGSLKERLTNLYNALNNSFFEKYERELGNGQKLTQVQKDLEDLRTKYKDLEKSKVKDQENYRKKQDLIEAQSKEREQQKAKINELQSTIQQRDDEIQRLTTEINRLRTGNKKLKEEYDKQATEWKNKSEMQDIMIDILSCENLVAMQTLGDDFRASDLVIPYLRKHHQTQQDAGFYEYCDKHFKTDIKRNCNVGIVSPKPAINSPRSPVIRETEDIQWPAQRKKESALRSKPKERMCVPIKPDPEVKKHVDQLKQRIKEKGSELPLEWRKIDEIGKKDNDSNLWGWFLDGKFINLTVQNNKLMCYKGAMKMDLLKYLSDYS